MIGDLGNDAGIGVAVAVGALEGTCHRLHYGLGRAIRVLVARQLREGVVVVGRVEGERTVSLGGEQSRRCAECEHADGCSDTTDESTTAQLRAIEHGPLRSSCPTGSSNPEPNVCYPGIVEQGQFVLNARRTKDPARL